MTKKILLSESATLKKKDNRWTIRVIEEGEGSSGYYSPEVVREKLPQAFPKGTQIYFNHITEAERWERGGVRDVRDLVGVFEGDPYEVLENGKVGLEAEVSFLSQHAEFMKEASQIVGLSVEAPIAYITDEGDVTNVEYTPLNVLTVVPVAGRGGKLKELQEKFSLPDNIKHEDEGAKVTEEQIKALAESIVAGITPAITELKESLAPKQDEPKTDEVDLSTVTESALEAGLSKTARARVVQSVKEGVKAEDAIATENKLMEEYKAQFESESSGRLNEAGGAGLTMADIFGGKN